MIRSILLVSALTLGCAPTASTPPVATEATQGPERPVSRSTLQNPNDPLAREVGSMAKVGGCWSPTLSPDGRTLAFVSNLNGVPQVWTVDAAGGFPRLVTTLDDQISGVTWSPTEDWIAFSMAPGGGMNSQVYLIRPDGTELTRITDGGKDNNWLGDWDHDGARLTIASSRRDPKSVDAWVYDVGAGMLQLVAENPGIGFTSGLSRDGKRAVIWRMKNRGSDDLVLRDLTSGEEHVLTPHEGPGENDGGFFSPDGRTIWLATNVGRDRTALARITLDASGAPSPAEIVLAREDADVSGLTLSDDGSTAALLWNASGRNELELLDLASMKREPISELPGEIVGGLSFSRDGKRLVMAISGATRPSDIWVLDLSTRELRQVTRAPHAGIDLDELVRPELVTYQAHDGLELSGWLYRPKGVSGRAPYVLSFHGGPEGQERPRFRSDYQALVARGIGVFAPNVRGSSGFGKRFVNLDNGALRFDGIRDIEASVRYLVDAGIADGERLGIMGGSYGGYMTMAGLAWYPDMFAAGANLFGVVNFETFFSETEPWMAAVSKIEYGDPDSEAELLAELSPINKINAVKNPTLVLHGANDTNVPVVEADQVVENLRSRGVPVDYVLFPDEGHGFRKTKNRITSTVSIVRWFETHLR